MAHKNTRLTAAELAHLQGHLQTALEVELSTVPIYLYTYYSINRSPSWNDDEKSGDVLATYANKAGGIIMSVVVEEMLHMSLAANILRAIGGTPKVYGRSPASFPTNLPHHKKLAPDGKPYSFGLEPLSVAQFEKFLEIELPEKKDAKPEGNHWETLGQFYDYITEQIKRVDPAVFKHHESTQLHGENGYYAPNNVDTIYPKNADWVKENGKNPMNPHPSRLTAKQAQFDNNTHSGGVRAIHSIEDAVKAMTVIKHQGEGDSVTDDEFDDKEHDEETHWYKFNALCKELAKKNSVVGKNIGQALFPSFVANPTLLSWSKQTNGASDDVINLVNAVYSYVLLLTETSYTLSGSAQHTMFYIGMHKAMIFILDKLIGNMRYASNYPSGFGGSGFQGLAPTFENFQFSSISAAKSQLCALATTVNTAFPGVCDDNIYQRINDLPDVSVDPSKNLISFATP